MSTLVRAFLVGLCAPTYVGQESGACKAVKLAASGVRLVSNGLHVLARGNARIAEQNKARV